jgi:hypothetical protein
MSFRKESSRNLPSQKDRPFEAYSSPDVFDFSEPAGGPKAAPSNTPGRAGGRAE